MMNAPIRKGYELANTLEQNKYFYIIKSLVRLEKLLYVYIYFILMGLKIFLFFKLHLE